MLHSRGPCWGRHRSSPRYTASPSGSWRGAARGTPPRRSGSRCPRSCPGRPSRRRLSASPPAYWPARLRPTAPPRYQRAELQHEERRCDRANTPTGRHMGPSPYVWHGESLSSLEYRRSDLLEDDSAWAARPSTRALVAHRRSEPLRIEDRQARRTPVSCDGLAARMRAK